MTTKKVTTKRPAKGKAETEETWDLVKVAAEQLTAARAVVRLLSLPGLPVWLAENIDHMLRCAELDTRVEINRADDDATTAPSKLARLFAVAPAGGLYKFERERDFAGLLSATLTHPDCPTELYNAVADLECVSVRRWDTPEALRLALGQPAADDTPRGSNDLARLISAVLSHEDLPATLRQNIRYGLSEVFNDLPDNDRATDAPDYLARLFALPAPEKGESEAGGVSRCATLRIYRGASPRGSPFTSTRPSPPFFCCHLCHPPAAGSGKAGGGRRKLAPEQERANRAKIDADATKNSRRLSCFSCAPRPSRFRFERKLAAAVRAPRLHSRGARRYAHLKT